MILHMNTLSVKVRMARDIFVVILSILKHHVQCAIRTSTDDMSNTCNVVRTFADGTLIEYIISMLTFTDGRKI